MWVLSTSLLSSGLHCGSVLARKPKFTGTGTLLAGLNVLGQSRPTSHGCIVPLIGSTEGVASEARIDRCFAPVKLRRGDSVMIAVAQWSAYLLVEAPYPAARHV
ncbi:hypothetical protein EDB84DRAFT_1495242 [Lactarius hengduanensis]|nr:hypothetical protein EDB84DRAFT_1495242 [Lactarius hengduanensis]